MGNSEHGAGDSMDEPWESGSGLGRAAAARRHGPTGGPHHVSTSRAPVLSIASQPLGAVIEQGLFMTKSPRFAQCTAQYGLFVVLRYG